MVTNNFSAFYKLDLSILINEEKIIPINLSDIVSITIANEYDSKSYPLFRIRLFTDITFLQSITEYPDKLKVIGTIDGGIYRYYKNETPELVYPTKSINLGMSVYIEYKNTPTSEMDKYVNGLPKTMNADLNVNNKVPIELYCYNYTRIHKMNDRPQSVYKEMSLGTIIRCMMERCQLTRYHMDTIMNQKRYDQVVIPNLTMLDSLSFFDTVYGLYPKGGMFFGGIDQMYICNLDSNNRTRPLPIYVKSYKDNSEISGFTKLGNEYFMQTNASAVSVLSESDIEKVLTPETLISLNTNTFQSTKENLDQLKEEIEKLKNDRRRRLITPGYINRITSKIILHKTPNEYVASVAAARINEKITRVDLSGSGFDIMRFTPRTRYNLIFDSPIRGIDMADSYRASYVCHMLTPTSQELFSATTTMTLCKN
jgi:hypothetical protein